MMIRIFGALVTIALAGIVDVRVLAETIPTPRFSTQAQFLMENIMAGDRRTLMEFIYDYENNRLLITKESTLEFYNFHTLKKAIYSRHNAKRCEVQPIDVNDPLDGLAAEINSTDNTTHIKGQADFLFLPSNATYLGETLIRGFVRVDQWSAPLSNDSYVTWSFAKADYLMPWKASNYSIPVQRVTRHRGDDEILQVLNVFSYRPMITSEDLTPLEGVYCDGLVADDDHWSLQDAGMVFPKKFSVRIDASTSAQQLWRSVHLRYHSSSERKLIRYDYTPNDNTESPVTVILDIREEAPRSYKINRRTGSCEINQTIDTIPTTAILHEPIEMLIKYENFLLSDPPRGIFQHSGDRACRGSIHCRIYVAQILGFPPESDDAWSIANIEWAWSRRHIEDETSPLDYPVYLNLNLYKADDEPAAHVRYAFYDYRTDVHLNEFDVSLCYRANQLWTQQLVFQLQVKNQTGIDGTENLSINRRRLAEAVHDELINIMSIKYLRIAQLELDHHAKQQGQGNDTLYCTFTLLDRTPFIDPNLETELLDARQKLERDIDAGYFRFQTDDGLLVEAVPKSLEDAQYFHAFNPNSSVTTIDIVQNITVYRNRTIVVTVDEIYERIQYSDGAQAGGVVGGMLAGVAFGTLCVLLVTRMIQRKTIATPTGVLTLKNISFRMGHRRKEDEVATISMEHPIDGAE